MREIFLILIVLLSGLQAAVLAREFRNEHKVIDTREDLRRLAALTLEFFHGKEPPQGTAFWQAIGRPNGDPIYDLWGSEYRLDIFPGETHREYLWISAGPDRAFGTKDDLKARVLFDRANPDLTHPAIGGETGPTSTDAK